MYHILNIAHKRLLITLKKNNVNAQKPLLLMMEKDVLPAIFQIIGITILILANLVHKINIMTQIKDTVLIAQIILLYSRDTNA